MSMEADASMANSTAGAEHVIRNRDDLIEVLRTRKDELQLSNAFIEAALHMAEGGVDKVLGPTQAKGLTLPVAFDLIELLAGRLVFQIDPQMEAKMQKQWEPRDSRKVHPSKRVSKKILALARPVFFKQLSKLGNEARKTVLPPEARSSIARAAALCRWRQHRATIKARTTAETTGNCA